MSWCRCCKSEDNAIKTWKCNTKYLINIVEKIQYLGKKCILNKQVNRHNSRDLQEIVKCFRKLDEGIHEIKLEAVQFMVPNIELLKQKNCQMSHYKEHATKQFQGLKKDIQTLKVSILESNVPGEEDMEPCSSHTDCNKFLRYNEHIENVPKAQLDARRIFLRQEELSKDLKHLLDKYNESINILKNEVNNLQKELQSDQKEEIDEESNYSHYESEEEIEFNNQNKYDVRYLRRRQRDSQEYASVNSEVYSSNETLKYIKNEFVKQGWPILQNCTGCLWTKYCISSNEQDYPETYSKTQRPQRNIKREVQENLIPVKPKVRKRNTNKDGNKPKNVQEESSSNQPNKPSGKKKKPKRDKSKDSKEDNKNLKIKVKESTQKEKNSGKNKRAKSRKKEKSQE